MTEVQITLLAIIYCKLLKRRRKEKDPDPDIKTYFVDELSDLMGLPGTITSDTKNLWFKSNHWQNFRQNMFDC